MKAMGRDGDEFSHLSNKFSIIKEKHKDVFAVYKNQTYFGQQNKSSHINLTDAALIDSVKSH